MLTVIKEIKGKGLPLRGDDIDTDRIIPARFLISTTFEGLGDSAFCDERFSPDGTPTNHPMNDKKFNGSTIIITNNNFGCGSSREHAPQAIKRAGYNLILAESFAEIFYGNSSVLGLVCITLDKNNIETILKSIETNPDTEISMDIEKSELSVAGTVYKVELKDALKSSLLNGSYDTIAELASNKDEVKTFEKNLPY